MTVLQRAAVAVNSVVGPLVVSPRWGRLVDRWMTVVTYTGRRSGRTLSIPVAYRQRGEDVTITVALPDGKTWWRNFTGAGGSVRILLRGMGRAGHAVAQRDDRGRVTVRVRLDPAGG